jgi:hypothetical protein
VLQFDTVEFGVLAAAEGLGALLGAVGLGLISRHLKSGKVLGSVLMLASVFMLGFIVARPLALSASFLFLGSVPAVAASIWAQTYFQQHVDDRLLGRVLGLTENISAVGVLAGVAAASVLGGTLETPAIMMIAVVVLFLSGAGALFALHGVSTNARTSGSASIAMAGELEGVGL